MRKPISFLAGATAPSSAAAVLTQAPVGLNSGWAGIGFACKHSALSSALARGRCIAAVALIGVEAG